MKVTIVYIWFLSPISIKFNTMHRHYFYNQKYPKGFLFVSITKHKYCVSQSDSLSLSLSSWPISFIGLLFFPQKRDTGEAMANGKLGRVKRKERTDNTSNCRSLAKTDINEIIE